MVAAFAICSAAVSCYDDSALREQDSALQDQIDILIDKVYELETRLSGEIEALQAMLRERLSSLMCLLRMRGELSAILTAMSSIISLTALHLGVADLEQQ